MNTTYRRGDIRVWSKKGTAPRSLVVSNLRAAAKIATNPRSNTSPGTNWCFETLYTAVMCHENTSLSSYKVDFAHIYTRLADYLEEVGDGATPDVLKGRG